MAFAAQPPRLIGFPATPTRFLSPGPVRRMDHLKPCEDEITARISRKTKRSRSSEQSERDICSVTTSNSNKATLNTMEKVNSPLPCSPPVQAPPFSCPSTSVRERPLSRNAQQPQAPPPNSHSRKWQALSRKKEKVSVDEVMKNYQLLMSDHLRLEKFLSFVTMEHEKARSRAESELLDAMMKIEDLKQALDLKMLRKPRIDPREAEERRSLIRQNKKLLTQLYEAARKIEKLEATMLELNDQQEMTEFHLIESENQRAIVEEQLKKISGKIMSSSETQTSPCGCIVRDNRFHQLEELVRLLKKENADLKEQLQASEEENSAAESDLFFQMSQRAPRGLHSPPRESPRDVISVRAIEQIESQFGLREGRGAVRQTNMTTTGTKSNSNLTGNENTEVQTPKNENHPPTASSEESKEVSSTDPLAPLHQVEFQEDSAVGQLILHSFFPASCMVSLEEEIMSSREKLPSMRAREADNVLAETIRTFQELMTEKDDEIIQLKQRLKELGVDEKHLEGPASLVSLACQTDLDMTDCELLLKTHEIMTTENARFRSASIDVTDLLQMKDDTEAENLRMQQEISSLINTLQESGVFGSAASGNDLSQKPWRQQLSALEQVVSSLTSHHPALTISDLKEESAEIKQLREDIEMLVTELYGDINSDDELKNLDANELRHRMKDIMRINAKWKSYLDNLGKTDHELLRTIASLEDELRQKRAEGTATQHQLRVCMEEINNLARYQSTLSDDGYASSGAKGPRYYSLQLQEVKHRKELDSVQSKCNLLERRKNELETRVNHYATEVGRLRQQVEDLESSLHACKRMENSLKRRLQSVETMRLMDSRDGTPSQDLVAVSEMESKIAYLEAHNQSVTDSLKLEQKKVTELMAESRHQESEKRALLDRFTELQARDICNQKALLVLQKKFEEIIAEYGDVMSHGESWKTREKAYENLQINLKEHLNDLESAKQQSDQERRDCLKTIHDLRATVATLENKMKEKEEKHKETRALLHKFQQKYAEQSERLSVLENEAVRRHSPSVSNRASPTSSPSKRLPPNSAFSLSSSRSGQITSNTLRSNKGGIAVNSPLPTIPNLSEGPPGDQDSLLSPSVHLKYWKQRLAEAERIEKQLWAQIQHLEANELKLNRRILELEASVSDAKRSSEVNRLRREMEELQVGTPTNQFVPPPGYVLVKESPSQHSTASDTILKYSARNPKASFSFNK